ncbi:PilT/PilU family type 4a pilus ATPase [Aliikangiella coralliicola]|uniref:PilT/PilU family type 4a pilus ATPase n=1 Tax=Aliikangiella coralliicola TaxID=2592383 RepID=A0A545UK53_9GAMM|nr:PilT/PilU family type 4a pilus ATPase [Aliikangiella coralliicola]TQV89852.1 PilT/PilU family type 4a pilus ATPase [Aliikangiella coralliicola]
MDLIELLGSMVVNQASDLFISVDSPPLIKVEGKMRPVREEPLNSDENHKLIYSILKEKDVAEFKAKRELNISLKLDRIGRFRINVFQQCGEPAMVIRYIKKKIPSIDELGLPAILRELILEERGLILLVGATGTGKSTTLASMIDYRNNNQAGHILTIEDPIEFIHKNKQSLVNQREVGVDTDSYEIALKNAMREAPDVILIGEIRDKETMKHALTYAETGHLCLATLHATNANQALERIVNFFPEDAHKIILQDLALNLNAVIAQRLCLGMEQKRVAAVEIMINTPFIQKLIEGDRVDEVKDAMARSKGRVNCTFDDALYKLVTQGKISRQEALRKADSANNLRVKFRLEDGNKPENAQHESEFIINDSAPFDHYSTFSITPLTVRAKHPDTKKKINNALIGVFTNRGLELKSKNTDLDVQYVLGLKVEEGLALEAIEGQQNNFEHFIPDAKEQAMLVINVLDNHTKKPIFRITAVREVSDYNESQQQLNAGIEELLKNLPVGQGHHAH